MRPGIIILLLCIFPMMEGQDIAYPDRLLATFGNMSEPGTGDDDFSQTIFFAVPGNDTGSFYIRVFDPDCGGEYDLSNGLWETNTVMEVFGGEGCISEKDARLAHPLGNYRSGVLLQRELFARESALDGNWFSFGPFRFDQGEELEGYPGYSFFKLLVEGTTGDDGNVYAVEISRKADSNLAVSYAAQFSYAAAYLDKSQVVMNPASALSGSHGEKDNSSVIIPVSLEKIPATRQINILVEPIRQ